MKNSWTTITWIVICLFTVLILNGCSGGGAGRMVIDTPFASRGSITGQVKCHEEIDLSEVAIMIREIKMASMPDYSGQFVLEKVPVGMRIIQAETEKYQSWPMPVTVQKDKTIDVGTLYLFEEPPLPPQLY